MVKAYSELLAVPGARAFVVPGLVLRLPMAMTGIGILMAYNVQYGSYGKAGILAACYFVLSAVMAPQVMRLVDRYGQARVAGPVVGAHVVSMVGVIAAFEVRAPYGVLVVCAVLAGATYGSMGSMVRSRWVFVIESASLSAGQHPAGVAGVRRELLERALALEGVLDELVYIVGPISMVFLAISVRPTAGLVLSVLCSGLGAVFFLRLKRSEPVPVGGAHAGSGVLRLPGVVHLLVCMVFLGGVFGALELATVATTEELGRSAWTGVTLACFAAGSLVCGVWFGTVSWSDRYRRRLLLAFFVLAVVMVPTVVAARSVWLMPVGFAAGAAIAPCLITGASVLKSLVPSAQLTEGFAWFSMSLALGVAAGTAITGVVVDEVGVWWGFPLAVLSAVGALVLAWWNQSPARGELRGHGDG